MNLGDFFPAALKEDIARRKVVPGVVLHTYCDFTTPPKNKFILVVSTAPFLVFFINSEINQYIRSKPHLMVGQVQIDQESHPFLSHDSWASCVDVCSAIDYTNVIAMAAENGGMIKGLLSESCIRDVIRATNEVKTVSPRNKRIITECLNGTLSCYSDLI